MKRMFLAALVLMMIAARAGAAPGFCDPTFTRKIPPLAETRCNATLYGIFPKIIDYKGQLLESVPLCVFHSTLSQSRLRVEYCKAGNTRGMGPTGLLTGENLDMTMEIIDMDGPEYQTRLAKAALKLELTGFGPALAYMTNVSQSSNKVIDRDMARVAMPGRNSDAYEFVAVRDNKYLVKIVIHGKGRFKGPDEVDAFVLEYTKAMTFPGN